MAQFNRPVATGCYQVINHRSRSAGIPTFLKFRPGACYFGEKTFGLSKLGKFDAVYNNWTAILNGLKVYEISSVKHFLLKIAPL